MPPDKLEFWIDINLLSCLADWINAKLEVTAKFIGLGYQATSDMTVFRHAANNPNVIVIKRVLYHNIGNVTNKTLRQSLNETNPLLEIKKDI